MKTLLVGASVVIVVLSVMFGVTRSHLNSWQAAYAQQGAEVARLSSEWTSLRASYESTNSALNAAQERMNTLTDEKTRLSVENGQLAALVKGWQAETMSARDEAATAQQALSGYRQYVDGLKAEVAQQAVAPPQTSLSTLLQLIMSFAGY